MKYLYLIALGGLNDILCRIQKYVYYCIKNNRLLFIDTRYGTYKYNIFRFIHIHLDLIIQKIKYFDNISINKLNFYPKGIKNDFKKIINNNFNIKSNQYDLRFNNKELDHDVIICAESGGGDSFPFFYKYITINNIIKKYVIEKAKLIKKPYIAIQIRNTDIITDYKSIYLKNKELIHKYDYVYIATDNKNVIQYFKHKNLNVKNFTEFPKEKHKNLHTSNISCETKFKNLFTDMYIILNAEKAILESNGGFSDLLKECYKRKNYIINNKFI
jgi:hypothetical protein